MDVANLCVDLRANGPVYDSSYAEIMIFLASIKDDFIIDDDFRGNAKKFCSKLHINAITYQLLGDEEQDYLTTDFSSFVFGCSVSSNEELCGEKVFKEYCISDSQKVVVCVYIDDSFVDSSVLLDCVCDIFYVYCSRAVNYSLIGASMISKDLFNLPTLQHVYVYGNRLIKEGEIGKYATVCMDIKGLNEFNAEYGIECGDCALTHYGNFVKSFLRKGECMARAGGDCFVIIIKKRNLRRFLLKTRSMFIKELPSPCPGALSIMSRYGVYINTITDKGFDGCVTSAFKALDFAKKTSNCVSFYTDTMGRMDSMHDDLFENFYKYLNCGEFKIRYRSRSDDCNDIIREAYVCWEHDGKLLDANDFNSYLEELHFLPLLDRYTLSEVCSDIRRWCDEGEQVFTVLVKLSKDILFIHDIEDVILGVIDEYGVPRNKIEFELNGVEDIQEFPRMVCFLHHMRTSGVSVSIVDAKKFDYSVLSSCKNDMGFTSNIS